MCFIPAKSYLLEALYRDFYYVMPCKPDISAELVFSLLAVNKHVCSIII